MDEILRHICSVKDICDECSFLKSNKDPESLKVRRYHLNMMKGDLLYRANCRSKTDITDGGDNPHCRGAAVYMHKTNKLNAALRLALETGVITDEELKEDYHKVIS